MEWRAIPGFAGYEVSDEGQVRSVARFTTDGKRLKPRLHRGWSDKGYIRYGLNKNNRQHMRWAHQLVLLAFVGPPPADHICRHLDGNRSNNQVDNLRWGTREENEADKLIHGTILRGEQVHNARLTDSIVLAIRGSDLPGRVLAKQFGVSEQLVSYARRGKTWRHVSARLEYEGQETSLARRV